MNKKILFVVTSHSTLGTTDRATGVWFEELATPYYAFTDAGYDVDIVSTAGGPVPIDPGSLQKTGDPPRLSTGFLLMPKPGNKSATPPRPRR